MALPDEAFAAELARRFGDFLGEVKPCAPRWAYPLSLQLAEHYTSDRLALVGDAAHAIPIERLLVETDAPYLAPVPHRGKPNEPAFTRHTAEKLAELKDMTLEEVARITTDNFFTLFDKAKAPKTS